MIRTRLRFPAAAVAARRRARKRSQRASTSTADTNAAEVGPPGKPPIVSSLWAAPATAGREIKPALAALPANGARLMRVRRTFGRGRARSRGAAGRRSRGRTGTARPPGVGTEADARSPYSRLCSASTGTGRATVGAAVARGAPEAGARPVFTSRGSAPGAGTTAAGPAETTAGPRASTRDGSSPVADGPTGGTSAPGSKSNGSRYPLGSEARRTPR
jgi:hypothetical protein